VQYPERDEVFKSWPMWFHKVYLSHTHILYLHLTLHFPQIDKVGQHVEAIQALNAFL
jgi:hypothetical protein